METHCVPLGLSTTSESRGRPVPELLVRRVRNDWVTGDSFLQEAVGVSALGVW